MMLTLPELVVSMTAMRCTPSGLAVRRNVSAGAGGACRSKADSRNGKIEARVEEI
jgi:hypothetical protein